MTDMQNYQSCILMFVLKIQPGWYSKSCNFAKRLATFASVHPSHTNILLQHRFCMSWRCLWIALVFLKVPVTGVLPFTSWLYLAFLLVKQTAPCLNPILTWAQVDRNKGSLIFISHLKEEQSGTGRSFGTAKTHLKIWKGLIFVLSEVQQTTDVKPRWQQVKRSNPTRTVLF